MYVIGVDGGGSKTAAVVLDSRGRELGRGSAGSSNYHHIGADAACDSLVNATRAAVTAADLEIDQIKAITWALAGVDRPEERRRFARLAAERFPEMRIRIEHDAQAALVGGIGAHEGVVLIAGTGMVAYGEKGPEHRARAGGWGYFLDHGSGYDLAQQGLRAIGYAHDGSRPRTTLEARILQTTGLERATDIIGWVYAPERKRAEIAALAPVVLAEAARGDQVAVEIAAGGADALAEAVDAVARRLELWGEPFALALMGSLLTSDGFYRGLVVQAVQTRVPSACPLAPRRDAATGAGFLALELLGVPLDSLSEVDDAPALDGRSSSSAWTTEQPNALTADLDLRSTEEVAGLMHVEAQQAIAAVRPVLPAIGTAAEAIAARMQAGGRLIYVGAGTSGRLGVLDASECPPTFNTAPGQVVGLIAGGMEALHSSIEGAEDDAAAGARALDQAGVGPSDSVVGIAASGRTPYVIGALAEARRRRALTVALVCNLPSPVAAEAEHVLAPLVGPELVTGSTRLKSGTAQKVVLNMLSTAVMVQLGKTFGNLMVDLRQVSAKLRGRARRIVAAACGIGEEEAAALLERCDGDVKVAIVSHLAGCTAEEARVRLEHAGGVVRRALAPEQEGARA